MFFGEARGAAWWARFFAPGFRHVRAAAWYGEAQRWVLFDPSRRGLAIEVLTEAEFGPWFEMLLAESSLVLRFASRFERGSTPAAWHCVGAVKALLGLKTSAISPYALSRALIANGAEVVAPCVGSATKSRAMSLDDASEPRRSQVTQS